MEPDSRVRTVSLYTLSKNSYIPPWPSTGSISSPRDTMSEYFLQMQEPQPTGSLFSDGCDGLITKNRRAGTSKFRI